MSTEEELLQEISGYLHTYLKAGKLGINSFIKRTNVQIENLEQLLVIRFLIKEETLAFAKRLPILLKQFKTTTSQRNEITIGEVRGTIDWPETLKIRMARNFSDPTVFTINENIRSYDIPENLVLKNLLGVLYRLLFQDKYMKGFEHTDWFSAWQKEKQHIAYAYEKNIYLQRVPFINVSDRMIQQAIRHRNPLYREAAILLAEYRKLKQGDYTEEELETLLSETFITPDNIDVLFELYWIVQLVQNNTDASKLYLMDGTQNLVASWVKGTYEYRVYHDSVGSDDLYFNIMNSEIAHSEHPYLQQKYQSFQTAAHLADQYFQSVTSNTIWQGRPDFLVEIRESESNKIVRLIIGEVKNTSRVNYAITGMRELLDYIYFVKDVKGNYLCKKIPVEGILCVGDIEWSVSEETVKGPVQLVKRGRDVGLHL